MSMQNSNFQQENVASSDFLSESQYKQNQSQQNEYSGRNSQLKKNSIQKEQTPIQLQSKKENQVIASIQVQENDTNYFYISKRQSAKSSSLEKKQTIQPNIIQTEEPQQQTHLQVRKNSQLKIQPVFQVKIQITQYNNNYEQVTEQLLTPQNAAQQMKDIFKKEQNELKPVQLIQSNIFQSQSREIINRRSTNQRSASEFNQENSDISYQEQKLSSYEIKMGVKDDPMMKEKQDILQDIHEMLKQLTIKSTNKRHSILEDSLQLCLLFLPEIRQSDHQVHSQGFYEEIKLRYQLDRSYQAFKRRFYHMQLFADSWTIQNLQKMHSILKNSHDVQLDSYHINYSIINKTIDFPDQNYKKRSPEKPKVVQQIIANSQNKKIVLSLTTKTLCQYVNLTAKEIDEDIQEFDDELRFIDMILKLIPLAL
ncbi:unnamed protein product (macronuclear) [Paramecium tetraurelia]|uniref:Uncharacterized protein n=1 Tax=Paramecium tetraurelia TaxID=5888 RepID=A0BVW9_PARTE|nr:uncharacterized protein GSPATT00032538001 [Paramecium tetraurelia]CAK62686.1 unnamed protein product [Paramecium tetraurelia]|eukprot:XP_001430084.1 hypothetical protein (macronuclear) [Paramecium tetraurelia strain d4-2]